MADSAADGRVIGRKGVGVAEVASDSVAFGMVDSPLTDWRTAWRWDGLAAEPIPQVSAWRTAWPTERLVSLPVV